MRKLRKLKFDLLKFLNRVYVFFHKKSLKENVIIASSSEWSNKLREDFFLKKALNKEGINAKIMPWEELNTLKNETLIIKSTWGFHKNISKWNDWLAYLEHNNIKTLNPISIIKDNYNKEKQFSILDQNNIRHIDTLFIENDKNAETKILKFMKKYSTIVLKPAISESGFNTYKTSDEKELKELLPKFKNSKILVQPYIKDIDKGEYSLIYIDGKLVNIVLKYNDVFMNRNSVKYIEESNVPKELLSLGNKIEDIKNYKGYLFMRIDVVQNDSKYEIMEVELLDPNLYLNYIPDKKKKREVYKYFAQRVKKMINKE